MTDPCSGGLGLAATTAKSEDETSIIFGNFCAVKSLTHVVYISAA